MPEINIESFDGEERQFIANYVPGYDWVPGKFGPPPGILKSRKEQLDKMNDREYLYAFLQMSQEEKESLMVSEAERRRTFKSHWPVESIVKGEDCAKEGFYYTGTSDRVQCAFCGGIVRNWSRGDIPRIQHKNFFNYCKFVQAKPCHNIPMAACGLPQELMTKQLSSSLKKDAKQATLGELNINTNKPKTPKHSVYGKRLETYATYPHSSPVPGKDMCEAGFFYEGDGDKVKCFWCDGALEMWSEGDEPWVEHAKWYAGCTFVQQTKGVEFILRARAQMSDDNVKTADELIYNRGDLSFLDNPPPIEEPPAIIEELGGFIFAVSLEYKPEIVKQAYMANSGQEFADQGQFMEIIQGLAEDDDSFLNQFIAERERMEQNEDDNSMDITPNRKTTVPTKKVDVALLISNPAEPTEQEGKDLINAVRCRKCKKNMAGAVLLPCGCFCLCQDCSRKNLPTNCPVCKNPVKGACRTFLS